MTVLSWFTQKWFDQNHTNRSTKPISALSAASMRALASLRKSCRGNGTASGLAGAASIAACTESRGGRFFSALRSALYSKTARLAAPLVGRSGFVICPAPGRSSSAISAPRGSAAISPIDPSRGPNPNRCRASAASCGLRAIGKSSQQPFAALYAATRDYITIGLGRAGSAMSSQPKAVTLAVSPGRNRTVVMADSTMAGPATVCFGASASKS